MIFDVLADISPSNWTEIRRSIHFRVNISLIRQISFDWRYTLLSVPSSTREKKVRRQFLIISSQTVKSSRQTEQSELLFIHLHHLSSSSCLSTLSSLSIKDKSYFVVTIVSRWELYWVSVLAKDVQSTRRRIIIITRSNNHTMETAVEQ